MGILFGKDLWTAAIPASVKSKHEGIQEVERENPEQSLAQLAQRLGLIFTKTCTDIGNVEIKLEDAKGRVCAYVNGIIEKPHASMHYMHVVDSSLRRSGIGRLLFLAFRDVCREKGCERMRWLAASYGKNQVSHDIVVNFYKKLGARTIPNSAIMEYDIIPQQSMPEIRYSLIEEQESEYHNLVVQQCDQYKNQCFIPSKL